MVRIDERGPPIVLDDRATKRLAAALDCEGVVAASLFGSHASGNAGPLSDVDLAVWLDPSLERDRRYQLGLQLGADAAAAIGTDELDLVVLNDAPPLLRQRVLQHGRRLVERDARGRVRLETRGLLDYLDTQPLRDELARGLRHRLAEGRFGRR